METVTPKGQNQETNEEPFLFAYLEFVPEGIASNRTAKSTGCAGREDEFDD